MEADPMANEVDEFDELKDTHKADEIDEINKINEPEAGAGPVSNVVPSEQQAQAGGDPELEDFLEQAVDAIQAPHPPVSAKQPSHVRLHVQPEVTVELTSSELELEPLPPKFVPANQQPVAPTAQKSAKVPKMEQELQTRSVKTAAKETKVVGGGKKSVPNIAEHQIDECDLYVPPKLKDAAATHNATLKGCLYVLKALKHILDLNLTVYNKTTTVEKAEGSKGKGKDEAKPEGLMVRVAHAHDEIKKKLCHECNAMCLIVPQANLQPLHKPLKPEHIDLWADHVLCTISQPLPSLVPSLADAPPRGCNQKDKAPSINHNPPKHKPSGPPSLPTNLIRPNPPFPGSQYPIYQPQTLFNPSSSYIPQYFAPPNPYQMIPGFGQNPMLQLGYGTFPPYPPPTALVPPYNTPHPNFTVARPSCWLSDWPPSLDAGEHGRFGDQFGSLVSGFTTLNIVRLSHLRDYTAHDIEQISFFSPEGSAFRIPPPTAAWPMAYVHEDLPLYDPSPPSSSLDPNAGPSHT
ncbi:hypothetical protein FS749_007805 [Ceratobasidium sp. UAMH 11750]|nr:hypothetical protein FS749_007805 [Ceratobasidium sp. UAMH 11750]